MYSALLYSISDNSIIWTIRKNVKRLRLFGKFCASMWYSALCSAVTDNSFPSADWWCFRPLSRKQNHRYICSTFPQVNTASLVRVYSPVHDVKWTLFLKKKYRLYFLHINDFAFYLLNDWSMLTGIDCSFLSRIQIIFTILFVYIYFLKLINEV